MIINPQIFNNKIIIGSLAVALVVIGTLGYTSYNNAKESNAFLEQEKHLVQSELSEMISSYNAIDVSNESIGKQLEETKSKIIKILDSVEQIDLSFSEISKYKLQIKVLKKENLLLLSMVDSLESENAELKLVADSIVANLDKTKGVASSLQTKNKTLSKRNINLKEDLEIAKQFKITNIVAEGVKRVTSSNKVIDTKRANRTNQFQVCFTLLKNELLTKGDKSLYIQVLDSKMNVIADKGTVNFGNTSLIYSDVETVAYNNKDLEVCALIEKGSETLVKGMYFISIFHQGNKLGRTTIELK